MISESSDDHSEMNMSSLYGSLIVEKPLSLLMKLKIAYIHLFISTIGVAILYGFVAIVQGNYYWFYHIQYLDYSVKACIFFSFLTVEFVLNVIIYKLYDSKFIQYEIRNNRGG